MKKSLYFVLTFFAVICWGNQAAADNTTCADSSDVFIDEYSPDENFNYKTRLLVSYHPTKGKARVLMKFAIPAGIDSSQIDNATLHLSGSRHTGGGYSCVVSFFALNAPFDENTATWNSLSGGSFDNSTEAQGILPAGVDWYVTINAAALIKNNLDKVRSNGILMKLSTEGADKLYQNIASRECDNESNLDYIEADEPPRLEIVYSLPPSTTTSSTVSTTTTSEPVATTTTTSSSGGGGGGGGGGSATSTTTVPVTTTSSVQTTSTTVTTTTTSIVQPPPETTTTTSVKQPCVITRIAGEDNQNILNVLRKFRDGRLATSAEGLTLAYLYYNHSRELIDIFASDPALMSDVRILLITTTPAIDAGLFHDGRIVLKNNHYEHIIKLVKCLQGKASPELNRSLTFILDGIENGCLLEKLRIYIED